MKHYSKINKKIYNISQSVDYSNHILKDDITIIWQFEPFDEPTKLVGWYYGGYDFDATETYIKEEIKNGTIK